MSTAPTIAPPSTRSHFGPRDLVATSLAYFMVLLDITVLAVVEPDLIRGLHTDAIGVGWATTSYTICLAAFLVLAGALADRIGATPMFVAGVVGFGATSLACAASPSILALVLARGALGLCAAAIIPSSMALIAGGYREPARRARAIAVWAAISGAAMAAGPLVGGALVMGLGWRAVFAANLPVVLVVLFLRRGQPIGTAVRRRVIDPRPHLMLALTLALATVAVTEIGQRRLTLAAIAAVAALLLGGGTVRCERRSAAPIVPSALRRSGGAWLGFAWGGAINLALSTLIFTIPLSLHATPVGCGLVLLPMTAMVAFNPLLTGRIVASKGPLLPIRMGLLSLAVGAAVTAVEIGGGVSPALECGLLLCGLGISWALPALVAYVVGQAPVDAAGAVAGLLNATRQAGATLGAAAAAALLAARPSGGGAEAALLLAAATALLAAIGAWSRRGR